MRKAVIGALLASTLAVPAMAQSYGEVRHDRREVNQDQREVNRDLRRGDYGEARRDARELRADRRELRDDRRDFHVAHRGDWHRPGYVDQSWSRRGWTRDWRNNRVYDWRGYRDVNRGIFAMPAYVGPRGWAYRRYSAGARIAPIFYAQRYWIADPWRYRLPWAAGYQRWVRYGDDVLLIETRSGVVLDVISDFFWR
jgi:Ni/Co efflux regulator RcnB